MSNKIAAKERELLKRYLPLNTGPVNIILIVIQLIYFLLSQANEKTSYFTLAFGDLLIFLYSFLTLTVLVQCLNTINSKVRTIRAVINLSIIVILTVLFAYHSKSKTSLDYSVIGDNIAGAFSMEAFHVIMGAVSFEQGIILPAIMIVILLFFEKRSNILSRTVQTPPLLPKVLTAGLIYCAMIAIPINTYDEVTYFLKTTFHYYSGTSPYSIEMHTGSYPYIKNQNKQLTSNTQSLENSLDNPPNIIIIAIESFSARFIEAKTPTGIEYTPNMNKLIKKGTYIEHYYGNSVQTSKGHVAILTSVIPSIRGKIYTHYPDINLHSLPEILKSKGYRTVFFQAYGNINFDNTGSFTLKNGFQVSRSVNDFLTEDERNSIWGWGVEDAVFYKKFFHLMDEEKNKNGNKPIFAMLATISNHMRFNSLPPEKRNLYKEPANIEESYANSINLTDRQISVFFEEMEKRKWLDNSIIIITGDHSFPLGEHGFVHNEAGFYEESFRVPFLMLWDGKISPTRISEVAYSHLDIAPTILEILNLTDIRNHFTGVPIDPENKRQHQIYLVQPYGGRYLGVINYPAKYVLHERSGREYYFNLIDDTGERNNLIGTVAGTEVKRMRDQLTNIYLNQRLLEMNLIWPGKH